MHKIAFLGRKNAIPNILITGSLGQIGTELTHLLRKEYGTENIIDTDIRLPEDGDQNGPFEILDVLDRDKMTALVKEYHIDWLVHNASILSAKGESNPTLAMKVNNGGFENAINTAKEFGLRILAPSSIAAFGPTTPPIDTPDLTIMRPTTIYGITKIYMELLGEYYHAKWDVDFRSIRYPGIISSVAPPGGGTTDYAVSIFYDALRTKSFECFLTPDMELPMMYMPDCLDGTMQLLRANSAQLKQRTFNIAAFSFTPHDLERLIQEHIPEFRITYKPDYRQEIAASWPKSISDIEAKSQWHWQPQYDLDKMVSDMLDKISLKLNIPYESALKP